jgi:hypothetical protein
MQGSRHKDFGGLDEAKNYSFVHSVRVRTARSARLVRADAVDRSWSGERIGRSSRDRHPRQSRGRRRYQARVHTSRRFDRRRGYRQIPGSDHGRGPAARPWCASIDRQQQRNRRRADSRAERHHDDDRRPRTLLDQLTQLPVPGSAGRRARARRCDQVDHRGSDRRRHRRHHGSASQQAVQLR